MTREARSGCVAVSLAECLVLWFCVSLLCDLCVTVIARLASTHTALVSQSLVGLCFAFPSMFVYIEVMWSLAARRAAGRT